MSIHTFQPASPLAADGAALAQALRRAMVGKDSLIRVTGPAALTAVLWLARSGYQRAVLTAGSTVRSGEPADALLIPQPCSCEQLRAMLAHGDGLRAGGMLIVQIAKAQADGGPDDTAVALPALGFDVCGKLAEKGRTVLIARRAGSGGVEKAA